ncbi:MAG: hypothetical protein R3E75_08240 [Steroidobacteraceae bacterium]|nr:hypothetical protein [Nevskiaceae bacterium]MCP5472278.1 hypothetical protein [Nevskiaceae bacterium]
MSRRRHRRPDPPKPAYRLGETPPIPAAAEVSGCEVRFCICPSCRHRNAPIPVKAAFLRCRGCAADLSLKPATTRTPT